MKARDRRRFQIAILISLVAHLTALVVLMPLIALFRAGRALLSKENENLRVALLLAILLHIVLILPLLHLLFSLEPEPYESERLEVDLWSRETTQLASEEKEKTPEEELEEYEPEEKIPEGQVVQAPPSKDRRKPEKTRFLAEHDSRVEKETRSRIRLPGIDKTAPSPELKGQGKESQTLKGGMRAAEQVLGPPPPPDLDKTGRGQSSSVQRAPPSLEDINLQPSMESIASALAGTGLDNLDGIIDGDMTALNTTSWEFASFFNRVKRQVERRWHPGTEYRKRDPYGNIYGFKDRATVLLVVLRGDGSLKKIYIMDPSGAPFLDEEAKRAVELAAPFPNVPEGLKDKRDGLVKFTFHFLVQIGAQPIFRMRRYE